LTALLYILFISVLVVVVQTASVGFVVPVAYKPDIMLILVVWASLRLALVPGIAFAFVGGLLMDFFSGSPTGLFALVYCLTFVAAGSANTTFDINRPLVRACVICAATLASGSAVVLTRLLAGPVGMGLHTVLLILAKSVATGLTSLVVFPFLERSWVGYGKLVGDR